MSVGIGTPPIQPWYHLLGWTAADCEKGQVSEKSNQRWKNYLSCLRDFACPEPVLDQRLGACNGDVERLIDEWGGAW